MRHQDYRTYLLLVAACALGTACSCAKQYSASSAVSCNPFEQLTSIAATVPRIVSPASSGGAVLLGYVADSATRNGLSGAMVSFIRRAGNGVADTTATHSDSAGGFAIRIPVRGRYYYSVRAINFSRVRDSIDVTTDAETVRVVMRRGAPLCNVQTAPPVVSPTVGMRIEGQASVTAFDSAGRHWRRYVSHRFLPAGNLMLHETASRTCPRFDDVYVPPCQDEDPHPTTFLLEAFTDSGGKLLGPVWRTTVSADAADLMRDDFYRATLYGSSAFANGVTLVSIRNGQTVFLYTSAGDGPDPGPPNIQVMTEQGLSRRFAAFHDQFSEGAPPEAERDSDLAGILQYGPADGPTQRLLVSCPGTRKRGVRLWTSPTIRVAGYDSRDAIVPWVKGNRVPPSPGGFEIHVTLIAEDGSMPGGRSLLVPVENDSMNTTRATVPERCTLHFH